MSIKLNGGSNPTSVTYNGSAVYEVKYKTSSSATAVTVWKKPYSVTIEDIFDTSGFLDEDGNYYPGGKVTNYIASWNSGDSKQIKVGSGEGTHTAYWSDSVTVTWPAMYMTTVMQPVLFRDACSTTVSVTSDVTITPNGGSVIQPELPTSGWVTDYRIVDYKTYTITARIECPVLPPATTTTTYNIAGKTGSVTGDVTSGQTVTNTFTPSLTTKNFTCTVTNQGVTRTQSISNPFYHSSGKPDKPTITLVSVTATQIKYTVYNPNNHPIRLEYGAEEAWGVNYVEVSKTSSKTFTQTMSGNWQSVELCADACAGNNKWSGYTYLTVANPSAANPMAVSSFTGAGKALPTYDGDVHLITRPSGNKCTFEFSADFNLHTCKVEIRSSSATGYHYSENRIILDSPGTYDFEFYDFDMYNDSRYWEDFAYDRYTEWQYLDHEYQIGGRFRVVIPSGTVDWNNVIIQNMM